tara:strand:- start:6518 stop:7585 length:1068 start_codon:yes stop_codon:yes gene_type:complete
MVFVNQYSPHIQGRDAIGNNIRALRKMFEELGYQSDLFHGAREEHPTAQKIERYTERNNASSSLLIHYSMDDPKLDLLRSLPGKKTLIYHNITPPEFFQNDWPEVAEACRKGREKLSTFKDWIDCAIGITDYNFAELERAGIDKIFRVPLLIDFSQYNAPANPTIAAELMKDDTISWLFVGRVLAHKKQDDLIRVFHYYQKYINPRSRLNLVGAENSNLWYTRYIEKLIKHLDVRDVTFTGSISQKDLLAYYRHSDIFLCLSEHEGLCVPIIEAMLSDLPIIAYDAAAIRETLGHGGVLIKEKRFAEIAELSHYILQHSQLKSDLSLGQKERLEKFSTDKVREGWRKVLNYIDSL